MTGLTGLETLQVLGQDSTGRPAATTQTTTTGAIAILASTGGLSLTDTAITTAGNGTLTAPALVGGQISRSGPTGAFSDTTATAALIIAALPGEQTGSEFQVLIKNTTAYVQTITAGSGVTLPNDVIVPPYSASLYFVTVTSGSAVTFTHRNTTPNNMLNVSLQGSTSGATVLESSAIASGLITFPAATDTVALLAATQTLTNKTLTAPTINGVVGGTATSQTITTLTSSAVNSTLVVNPVNTVTVTTNAGTCPVTSTIDNFTNSSSATMAITIATAGAVDGQIKYVRIYDFAGTSETIGWTNTENGEGTAPTTSNGSTTLPKTAVFQFNGATTKWRCIIS